MKNIEENKKRGIWIPISILNLEDLNGDDKILLSEIITLHNNNGCYASNQYFAELLNVKSLGTPSKKINKLETLGYIKIEYKYKNGHCIGRIIIPLFNIEEKSPYPQNVPMEVEDNLVLPNGNRVLPNGNRVLPNGNRVLPNGNRGTSKWNRINKDINKDINTNINKVINNILVNTGANILGQTQIEVSKFNNFSIEENNELEENPELNEIPELEEIDNEPSTERIEEPSIEDKVLELEKLKSSITSYLLFNVNGEYINWNWQKEFEENDLYDFKLIALKMLGEEELSNGLIQLLETYQLKNKILNLQLK